MPWSMWRSLNCAVAHIEKLCTGGVRGVWRTAAALLTKVRVPLFSMSFGVPNKIVYWRGGEWRTAAALAKVRVPLF